jgi:hypothetical protein
LNSPVQVRGQRVDGHAVGSSAPLFEAGFRRSDRSDFGLWAAASVQIGSYLLRSGSPFTTVVNLMLDVLDKEPEGAVA